MVPRHGFFASRSIVYSWFMDLGNPVELVVHHLLIKGITCLGRRDEFPIMSALMYVKHTR